MAQTVVVPLWPEGKMPGHGAKDPEAETPGGAPGTVRVNNVSTPTLSFYPATASSTSPAPIVMVCPGGGYNVLAFTKEGTEIAQWLNSLGLSAAVLKYRVPANRGGALQDFQRGLRVIRSHAKDWKIDPARIGAIGFSAGGHLTALACSSSNVPAYPSLDDVDKLSARPDFAILVYPAYLEKAGQLAPEFHLTSKVPPLLIVHNEDDAKFIAGSKVFDAALTAASIPHDFLLFQAGGHGYGLHSSKDVGAWPDRAKDWLIKNGIIK
ncbi:alpha/beta hydrolase [soil metagenome]